MSTRGLKVLRRDVKMLTKELSNLHDSILKVPKRFQVLVDRTEVLEDKLVNIKLKSRK